MSGRRSTSTHLLVSALILACSAAIVSGCSEPRPAASSAGGGDGGGGSKACTLCHGDENRLATTTNPQLPAAPPKGSNGEIDVSTRAVGAHQLHLQDGAVRSAVACAECHVVPTIAAHANGKVDLAFGTLATTGGAVPLWNGSSCSASYCHGGFAGGNATNAPVWTQARASSCGTCHGLPPAAPHPDVGTGSNCGSCHTGYTATTVNLTTHMDGKVDVANLTCSSCHGDSTRADTTLNPRFSAAPPKGSKGETATTSRAVGAHALHLKDGTSFACTECHVVPTSTSHSNGTAEIAFGTIAATGGTSPAWNGATCSNVYCHGSFTGGNRTYAPTWTNPVRDLLRHLPRRSSGCPAHPEHRLRLVPHRLHLHDGQRLAPREREGRRREPDLLLLPWRRDASRDHAQPRSPRRAAQGRQGQHRHHRPRRRRPPAPPGRRNALGRNGLRRVPRHPHQHHPLERRRRGGVWLALEDRRRQSGLERLRVRLELLPRQLQERHDHLRPQLDGSGGERLRDLPRPASRRDPPGQRCLRDLPRRLHRDIGQPCQSRERRGGRHRPLLHHVPRLGGARRAWPEPT